MLLLLLTTTYLLHTFYLATEMRFFSPIHLPMYVHSYSFYSSSSTSTSSSFSFCEKMYIRVKLYELQRSFFSSCKSLDRRHSNVRFLS